jgi:hypothetical protein
MSSTLENLAGSVTTLLSTELNSLANNASVLSSVGGSSGVFDNTIGNSGVSNGYFLGDVEMVCAAFGSAPTANTALNVWFLQTIDGTNYEDGSSSITPVRPPNVAFQFQASTNAQRLIQLSIPLPAGKFKVLAQNNGSGQTMAGSGNTIKVRPTTPQGQNT